MTDKENAVYEAIKDVMRGRRKSATFTNFLVPNTDNASCIGCRVLFDDEEIGVITNIIGFDAIIAVNPEAYQKLSDNMCRRYGVLMERRE